MTVLTRTVFAVAVTAFATMAAVAQDVAVASDEASDGASADAANDALPLTVLERWQADRTTIFDASEIDMADLEYIARLVVIFADSPNQPDFIEQLRLIADDPDAMVVRDVILVIDSDPDARSELRRELRPRGFSVVMIDKDGRVTLRKPEPWDMRELSRQIDKMPLRLQEIRERLGSQ